MPEILAMFGCKNPRCAFFSPYGENKICIKCIPDWESEC